MSLEQAIAVVSMLGSVATAFALIVAIWQLHLARKQAITDFEDELDREYRKIIAGIPVKAILGDPLSEEEFEATFSALYRYIDLSNKQVFLRQDRRVSKHTWLFWRDGIQSNLSRQPFDRAWKEIKDQAASSFSELRQLEASSFSEDPASWPKAQ
jgi:hypothetical protein